MCGIKSKLIKGIWVEGLETLLKENDGVGLESLVSAVVREIEEPRVFPLALQEQLSLIVISVGGEGVPQHVLTGQFFRREERSFLFLLELMLFIKALDRRVGNFFLCEFVGRLGALLLFQGKLLWKCFFM